MDMFQREICWRSLVKRSTWMYLERVSGQIVQFCISTTLSLCAHGSMQSHASVDKLKKQSENTRTDTPQCVRRPGHRKHAVTARSETSVNV